ncbi:MAG TPA: hypothetical protein VLB67_12785, partial [Acidimicrobiia bacterium]|nr:hypothetical protein [Acidimicrobiia bacterium]
MLALVIIEGIVILLLAVLVAGLLRSHADILRTLDRIERGGDGARSATPGIGLGPTRRSAGSVPVDTLAGLTLEGEARTVALRGSRGFVLAAFLSSGCTTCRSFWSSFDKELELPHPDIRPVIVTKGAHEESPSDLSRLAPRHVLTLLSSETWDAFRVPGTPYFQLIDVTDGAVLGEGSAASWARLMELIRRAIGDTDSSPLGRSTAERLVDSDEELRRAGIEP